MRDRETRELLYKTLAVLYRYADDIAVLEYPKNIERRSIDLVVRLHDGRSVLVKVASDVDLVPRSELIELASLSSTLELPSLVISLSKSGAPLVEGVVYEKYGLQIVNLETLESVLSGREEVYIYEGKDCFKLSINADMIRAKRLEKKLSLGDLALTLGVSRRAVYEYEKGNMEPSIEKGEKLIQILGEDIVKPIDLFQPAKPRGKSRRSFDSKLEEDLARSLESSGYRLVHAKRTVVDLSASKTYGEKRERLAITVEHPREKIDRIVEKAYYMDIMAKAAGIEKRFVVVEKPEAARKLEREGIIVHTPKEFIASVAEDARRGERRDH